MKTAKGKDLFFVSRISRNGKGVVDISEVDMSHLNDREFKLTCLSITEETFIASEFNSYVVRFR